MDLDDDYNKLVTLAENDDNKGIEELMNKYSIIEKTKLVEFLDQVSLTNTHRIIIHLLSQSLDNQQLLNLMQHTPRFLETFLRTCFGLHHANYESVASSRFHGEEFKLFKHIISILNDFKPSNSNDFQFQGKAIALVSILLDKDHNLRIRPIHLTHDEYKLLYEHTLIQDLRNVLSLSIGDPKLCELNARFPFNEYEVEIRLVLKSGSSESAYYFLETYDRFLLTDSEKFLISELLSLEHLHKLNKNLDLIPKVAENQDVNKIKERIYSNIRVTFNRYIPIQLELFNLINGKKTDEKEVEEFIDFCLEIFFRAYHSQQDSQNWSWIFSVQIEKLFDIIEYDSILEKYWGKQKWPDLNSISIIQEGILTRINSPLLVTKLFEYGWEYSPDPTFLDKNDSYIEPNIDMEEGLDRVFAANFSLNQEMRSWKEISKWDINETYYFKKFNEAIHEGQFSLAKFCEPATKNRVSLMDMAKNENEDELARYTAIILLHEDEWYEYGFLNLESKDYQRACLEKINDPILLVKLRLIADDPNWSVIITEKVNKLRKTWVDRLFRI